MPTFRFVVEGASLAAARAVPGVHVDTIVDRSSAATAVLAAVAGRDLVLRCDAPDKVVDELLDDLARLGTVVHEPAVRLTPQQGELLAQLRDGHSLGEAARALHISRRTADRRLASARTTLGVRTTTEAVIAARQAGLL
jgi:DNA-binding NarL/FixJ family response regulator